MTNDDREASWELNMNRGMDVIHVDPEERCNTDDALGRKKIDPETAHALVAMGDARYCDICSADIE